MENKLITKEAHSTLINIRDQWLKWEFRINGWVFII